jgi:hypothetical protein
MAGAKQLVTLGFILVPAGGCTSSRVCSRHYIARTVVLLEGATSEAGEKAGSPDPRGTDWGKCQYLGQGGKCVSEYCPSSPAARGLALLL